MPPHIYESIEGWFTYKDLYDQMVRKYPGGVFLEIGCWFGRSGVYLLEKILEEKSGASVIFVDTFKGEEGVPYQKDMFKERGEDFLIGEFINNTNKVPGIARIIIQEDSLLTVEDFPDEVFDFVFIDGFHPQCYEDMVAYYPKVKKGGTLAGHDINGEIVRKAVNRFSEERGIKINIVGGEPEYWWFEK